MFIYHLVRSLSEECQALRNLIHRILRKSHTVLSQDLSHLVTDLFARKEKTGGYDPPGDHTTYCMIIVWWAVAVCNMIITRLKETKKIINILKKLWQSVLENSRYNYILS